MHAKTEEFATNNLAQLPEKIRAQVKKWADENYNQMWYGLQRHQVLELVRKPRKKLGLGNYSATVENIPDYKLMTDSRRPFLQCSTCFPHPEDENPNSLSAKSVLAGEKLVATYSIST
jgi:hypothetical protein